MIVYLILKSSVLLAFGEAGYGAFREATKKGTYWGHLKNSNLGFGDANPFFFTNDLNHASSGATASSTARAARTSAFTYDCHQPHTKGIPRGTPISS
jgi:hypothetical protein